MFIPPRTTPPNEGMNSAGAESATMGKEGSGAREGDKVCVEIDPNPRSFRSAFNFSISLPYNIAY